MHIDHSKLVELIVDASGIDKDKVEAQFAELISEISQAVNDGEAYEIEGFGIFSGIGNRLIFIPSKELETEINFKYVGMEPIEMDEASIAPEPAETEDEDDADDDDPFADLQTPEKKDDRYGSSGESDPFSGLVEELEEDEIPEEKREEYKSMLDVQEDESDDDVFGFGDEDEEPAAEHETAEEEPLAEDETIEEETVSAAESEEDEVSEDEDPFMEEFETEASEEESMEDEFSLEADASEDIEEEEEAPGPDQWGIDSHKEGESASNLFASLMGELPDDDEKTSAKPSEDSEEDPSFDELPGGEETDSEDEAEDAIQQSLSEVSKRLEDLMAEREKALEPDPEPEPEPEPEEPVMSEPEEEVSEKALSESLASQFEEEDEEDFDDPFKGFAEDDDEEEAETEKVEAMPVITNIASELKEKPAAGKKQEKPEKEKKLKPKKMKSRSKSSPAFLWVVLIMVILAGGILGAGYFGLIPVPGMTPQSADNNVAANTPPVQQTPDPEPVQQVTEQQPAEQPQTAQPEPEPEPAPQEKVTETPVSIAGTGEAPPNQAAYGLRGTATEEANDGYTIVLYSLSVRENAYAEQRSLAEDGYRAVVVPLPSSRYGTLWRVSIGQFATLQDAAIAAEGLGDTFTQDYFIKKITN